MRHEGSTQKTQSPTAFAAGVLLAEEKHEQKDRGAFQLLVAQLQFDGQLEHGKSPVCAGWPANWLRVGLWRVRGTGRGQPSGVFAAYVRGALPLPGITRRRRCGRPAAGSQFEMCNVELSGGL